MTYKAAHHFPRVWAARHDETVHVFASGYVLDKAARRETVRALVKSLRGERSYQA